MSENKVFCVSPEGEIRQVETIERGLKEIATGGYLWLDFFQPTREELAALIEPFGVHPLSIEDCLDIAQVPKIEDFPSHTFVLFNSYSYSNLELGIDEYDFFLGKNFLVTVTSTAKEGASVSARIKELLSHNLVQAAQGPDFLLYLVVDEIVDAKYLALEALEEEIDNAEELLLQQVCGFELKRLAQLRRELLSLRKSLFHEREILIRICRRDCPYVSEKAIYHYRDIYDHLTKFFEETDLYREMIVNLMEMYLSIINNKMAVVANRTNVTLRRLTFITTVFMPLTLLAGIGGMSEWSMMTGPENWKVSYPLFLLALGVIGAMSYYILQWLDSKNASDKALNEEEES